MIAPKRDWRPRKIQRLPSSTTTTFTRFGSAGSASAANGVAAVAISAAPLSSRCTNASMVSRLNLRLIALHVDDDRIGNRPRHLGHAIRPAQVLRRGHHAARAERPQGVDDPLIVRRHDDLFDAPALAHLVHDVLHQRLAGFTDDDFAGETCGSKPRGYNGNRSQSRSSCNQFGSTQNCEARIRSSAGVCQEMRRGGGGSV